MPKACLNCGTDNREEALFCRRCGTPFSSSQASPSTAEPTLPGGRSSDNAAARVQPAPHDAVAVPAPQSPMSTAQASFDDEDDDEDDEAGDGRTVLAGGAACPACGSPNAAGAATCGRCGAALGSAAFGLLPPSASGEATIVMPQPPHGGGPPTDTPVAPARAPLAGTGTAGTSQGAAAATAAQAVRRSPAGSARSTSRAGFWLALAVGMLLIAGLGFWLLGPRTPKPLADEPSPAAASAGSAARAEPPAASSADVMSSPATPASPASDGAAPGVATPPTVEQAGQSTTPSALVPAVVPAASAIGAEDEAKAAKLRLERAARAKAQREQRDPAAAAKKTAQDAEAQRQADDRARISDPAPSTAGTVRPAPATPRSASTAQDFCAGRGTFATAVCESRECGKPEHVDEARCRQVNAEEERRR